jgi:hypothetical protein
MVKKKSKKKAKKSVTQKAKLHDGVKKSSAKKSSKKAYKDAFLGKEVPLSESAYEVYNNLQSNPDRMLAIRDASPVIPAIKSIDEQVLEKLVEKEVDTKAKGKKQKTSPEDLIEKIKQEKEAFEDQVSGAAEQKKSVTEDFTNLNHSIYYQQPKGIFAVLSNDLFWYGIALSLILGVFLFFFQGLQPLILANYVTESKLQAQSLSEDYNQSIDTYFRTQQEVLGGFQSFNPTLLCTAQTPYDSFTEDFEAADRGRLSFFPNSDLEILDTYNNFYLDDADVIYNTLYAQYNANLMRYQEEAADLMDIPTFLNHRNTWLATCGELLDAGNSLATAQVTCSDFVAQVNAFQETEEVFFIDQIKETLDSGVSNCSDLTEANFETKIQNWFLDYDALMFYGLDMIEGTNELLTLNEDFVELYNSTLDQFDQLLAERTTLMGLLYVMKYEL